MKLNLGCGDKPIDGYINVDSNSSRKGVGNKEGIENQDIVQCDIRNLNIFEDNYAEEILSIHVIEHFYFYEIFDILKEWKRVLKPGGILDIETPNLIFACKHILENPINNSLPNFPEGKMGMWPLFGNPNELDPLMCHKWCYSETTLAIVLSNCGFVDIKKKSCRFKMKEPRDMRIVCKKQQ